MPMEMAGKTLLDMATEAAAAHVTGEPNHSPAHMNPSYPLTLIHMVEGRLAPAQALGVSSPLTNH